MHEISEIMAEALYKAPTHADEAEKKRLREEFAETKLKQVGCMQMLLGVE